MTNANGIDGDNIVGGCAYAPDRAHGFVYDGTTLTTFEFPGASISGAYDIDGDNIVGIYRDASGPHGFLYQIPEPATVLLLGLGSLALLIKRRA